MVAVYRAGLENGRLCRQLEVEDGEPREIVPDLAWASALPDSFEMDDLPAFIAGCKEGYASDPEWDAIWLTGEDLAPGAVGPFHTFAAAAKHLQFQWEREDPACVVHRNAAIVLSLPEKYRCNVCTPIEDAPELYGMPTV